MKDSRAEMTRRTLVTTGIAASAASMLQGSSAQDATPQAVTGPHPDVIGLTVEQAARMMEDGSLTAVDLTQVYLDRIAALDVDGPALASVLEVNPDALQIAAGLDAERAEGNVRGPMHGIP